MFPAKNADNGHRLVTAVRQLGFTIGDTVERDIIASKKASNRMKDRMDLHLSIFYGSSTNCGGERRGHTSCHRRQEPSQFNGHTVAGVVHHAGTRHGFVRLDARLFGVAAAA